MTRARHIEDDRALEAAVGLARVAWERIELVPRAKWHLDPCQKLAVGFAAGCVLALGMLDRHALKGEVAEARLARRIGELSVLHGSDRTFGVAIVAAELITPPSPDFSMRFARFSVAIRLPSFLAIAMGHPLAPATVRRAEASRELRGFAAACAQFLVDSKWPAGSNATDSDGIVARALSDLLQANCITASARNVGELREALRRRSRDPNSAKWPRLMKDGHAIYQTGHLITDSEIRTYLQSLDWLNTAYSKKRKFEPGRSPISAFPADLEVLARLQVASTT